MTVNALYDYEFASADRAENFGDDQLVYVHWEGNPFFCSAAAFRAPKAMPFAEFVSAMVEPWAGSDPAFEAGSIASWSLFDAPLDVEGDTALADAGVGHKALLTVRTS